MYEFPARVHTAGVTYWPCTFDLDQTAQRARIIDRQGVDRAILTDATKALRQADPLPSWWITGLDATGTEVLWRVDRKTGCGCGGTLEEPTEADAFAGAPT